MSIDIELKPLEVQVTIKDYGVFYVRRIGAAVESIINDQLFQVQKAIDDLQKTNAEMITKEAKLLEEKNTEELEKLRATLEYKELSEAQKSIDKLLAEVTRRSTKALMECWRSETEGGVEKLFNDLTIEQLRSAYQKVITEADNA